MNQKSDSEVLKKALQKISKKVEQVRETFIHISLIDKTKFFELGEIADKALNGNQDPTNKPS